MNRFIPPRRRGVILWKISRNHGLFPLLFAVGFSLCYFLPWTSITTLTLTRTRTNSPTDHGVDKAATATDAKEKAEESTKASTKANVEVNLTTTANAASLTVNAETKANRAVTEIEAAKRVEQDSITAGNEYSKRKKLTVHFYGGSITTGRGTGPMHRFSNKFQHMMQSYYTNVDLVVSNFGIPASNPEFWLNCGFGVADVIISEFRINSQRIPLLKTWYEQATHHSKHLVVLDLWSWLTPPDPTHTSATITAIPATTATNVSVVSLDQIEQDVWQELVPTYFNGVPQACFDALHMRSENETRQMEKCRKEHANGMQHGGAAYHETIAKTLYNHLVPDVITRILREGDTPIGNTTTTSSTLCISQWNLHRDVDYGNLGSWDMSIVKNEGFSINNPFPNPMKITLNTNLTSAQLKLNCPPPYNNAAKIGYIVHSNEHESGIFRLNGAHVSTQIRRPGPDIRIRKYSSWSTLPMNVSVEELPIGQYIEFTDLVCSNKYLSNPSN